MTKEKSTLATLKNIIEKLEILKKKITNDPLLFYGELGTEAILLQKELHVQGAAILRSGNIDEKSKELLKKIPIEE